MSQRTCAILLISSVTGCQTLPPAQITAPIVDTRSCEELAELADALQKELKVLTTPRELTGQDMAQFSADLLGYIYFFPILPLFVAGAIAKHQRPIDQNRARFAEVEQAMRIKGCPPPSPVHNAERGAARIAAANRAIAEGNFARAYEYLSAAIDFGDASSAEAAASKIRDDPRVISGGAQYIQSMLEMNASNLRPVAFESETVFASELFRINPWLSSAVARLKTFSPAFSLTAAVHEAYLKGLETSAESREVARKAKQDALRPMP